MSKNQERTPSSIEGALAERIGLERAKRDWSYERLSKELAATGCKVAASSLHKIERGTPRRPISVDELFAFARVFDMDVLALAEPVAVRNRERVERLFARHARDAEEMVELRQEASESTKQLLAAAHEVPKSDLDDIVTDWIENARYTKGRFENEDELKKGLLRFLSGMSPASPFDDAINSNVLRVPNYRYHTDPTSDEVGIRIQEPPR